MHKLDNLVDDALGRSPGGAEFLSEESFVVVGVLGESGTLKLAPGGVGAKVGAVAAGLNEIDSGVKGSKLMVERFSEALQGKFTGTIGACERDSGVPQDRGEENDGAFLSAQSRE